MSMLNLFDTLYDVLYYKVPEKAENLKRLKQRIKTDDRAYIYETLYKTLVTGKRSASDVFYDLSTAKRIEGKNSAAEAYASIARRVKSHTTNTPIADAFKEFVPDYEYESLKMAESDMGGKKNTLRQALPYIQAESKIKIELKRLFYSGLFQWALRVWLPLIVLYPNLSMLLPRLDPLWGADPYNPTYLRWTYIESFSESLLLFGAVSVILYVAFYYWYRRQEATQLRLFCNKLPLFKSYSVFAGASMLAAVALQMRVAQDDNLPRVISKVAEASDDYMASNLFELSDNTARTSLRDALAACQGISPQLRSSLVMTSANETDNKRIVENVAESVFSYVAKVKKARVLKNQFILLLSFAIIGLPFADVMQNSMATMQQLAN